MMNSGQIAARLCLALVGCGLGLGWVPSSWAAEPTSEISRLRDLPRSATTVKAWLAQIEAATVQVTSVKLSRTEAGLAITLETADGKPLQVDATKFRTEGNSLIADLPNAVLALPEGQAFAAENPTADIATVQVVQQDASSLRVNVTGNNALPTSEVTLKAGNLAYSLNPEAEEPDEKIVVTGEGQRGYRVPSTTTGTRLDIPLIDTPASIGVIPRELIEDTAPRRAEDLIPFVAGVTRGSGAGDNQGGNVPEFTVRGFGVARQTYINGLRDSQRFVIRDLANIEQVEILKGLSSLLYGTGAPGGVVNYITKKPQATSDNTITFQAGSFDYFRGELDSTGALNADKTLLYRFVVAAQNAGSFYKNVEDNRLLIAPSFTWLTGNGGSAALEAEYFQQELNFNSGIKFFNNQFLFDRSYSAFEVCEVHLMRY